MTAASITSMSVAEKEQVFLALNAKCSIALSFFWMCLGIDGASWLSTGVAHWIYEATLLCSLCFTLYYASKSWKFKGMFSAKAYWTMQFSDEYTDYVSALGMRLAFMVMSVGLMALVIIGDDSWFIELGGAGAQLGFANIILSLSFLLHGVVVLLKLYGSDEDE